MPDELDPQESELDPQEVERLTRFITEASSETRKDTAFQEFEARVMRATTIQELRLVVAEFESKSNPIEMDPGDK